MISEELKDREILHVHRIWADMCLKLIREIERLRRENEELKRVKK